MDEQSIIRSDNLMYKEKKEYEEKRFPIDKNHGKDKEDCKKYDWDEHRTS